MKRIVAVLSLGIGLAAPLSGQAPAPEPAEVMVVGVYHFANPGLDLVLTEVADVLAPDQQAEIRAVVEGLARFRPTKVAVEEVSASAARLDSLYRAFRASEHALTRNETEQLGFRLAALFDHPGVHPVDHGGEFPFGPVMAYAGEHDPAFAAFVQAEIERMTAETAREHETLSVGEILRRRNDPARLRAEHGLYMRFAEVGAGDTFVGAELLSRWYERNIRIFGNVRRLAEPGERIIVIIGHGHAPIIRELIAADPELVLVDPVGYLPE